MVVPYQIGHTVDLFCCHAGIRQELPHQRGTLLLLIFTIGVAVLFAAERAGDIVGDGRHLQNKLRVCVQPLQLTNGFGICYSPMEVPLSSLRPQIATIPLFL